MAKFIKIGCNTTPPGDYCLLIRQEGYISKVKILKVIPNQIYIVTEKLFAKDRSLLPIDFHDRPLPREVFALARNKKIFFSDKFSPGRMIPLAIKYDWYKTAFKSIYITPGKFAFFYDTKGEIQKNGKRKYRR